MSGVDSISRLFPLIDRLEQRARPLVIIAVVALSVGLIWAVAASASSAEQIVVLGPALALVIVGLVLLLGAASVELLAKEEVAPGTAISVAAPGGKLVLGCWFGRTTVACGALEVAGDPGPGVPRGGRLSQFVEVKETQLSRLDSGSSRAYDALAALVLDRVRVAQGSDTLGNRRFSSIGIGTPGIVDLQTGILTLSVTVPDGSDIPREVARRLLSSDKHVIRAAFGEDSQNESALAERIYVDNDVRCIARHELANHGWSEFACLYAGGGVGGALVKGGCVHYGAHGSAGHVGHIDLGEASIATLPAKAGQELKPVRCDCGKVGFHLEPLANFRGFERLARAVADADGHELLDGLLQRNGQDSSSFFSEVFPAVVASASGRITGEVPERILDLVAETPDINEYANRVLRAYVTVLTGGIATLTHILDFERVVLCGPLVEQLRQNELFAQYVRELLPPQLIDPGARPTVHDTVVREALWRGAALTGWDSGYHEHRKVASTA
jgi:predicted NBD/HSP70 family sugar kinase